MKENVSRDINRVMGHQGFEGDTSTCRLQIRRSIAHFQKEFIKKYKSKPFQLPKFQWQKSFYDHYIRCEKDFEYHMNYVINNHKKHGLPDDWPYTSLNYPALIDETDL